MIQNVIKGDLITLALQGKFQVVAHGCNCFNKQKAGTALAMSRTFATDTFEQELVGRGNINKLGTIDWGLINLHTVNKKPEIVELHKPVMKYWDVTPDMLYIVNMYNQFMWAHESNPNPLNYAALELGFTKMNIIFRGYHVGIPKIGSKLAGGDWNKIKDIINSTTPYLNITLIE